MTTTSNSDKPNTFILDDREVEIRDGETIFRAARRVGIKLPHLCYSPKPGYRLFRAEGSVAATHTASMLPKGARIVSTGIAGMLRGRPGA